MPFISVTRLRIRSIRFVPWFAIYTVRSLRQVRAAKGFTGGELLMDRQWTFWTMTSWHSQAAMRSYMTNGAHMKAMPYLMHWCDEASVVHWDQESDTLPPWTEADERMRGQGRISKVRNQSPNHASMDYRAPRLSARGPIQAKADR